MSSFPTTILFFILWATTLASHASEPDTHDGLQMSYGVLRSTAYHWVPTSKPHSGFSKEIQRRAHSDLMHCREELFRRLGSSFVQLSTDEEKIRDCMRQLDWTRVITKTDIIQMSPFTNINSARHSIEDFDGSPENFRLPVSDALQDSLGTNMAVITDAILSKGWEVDGFDQKDGYRVYRYKSTE